MRIISPIIARRLALMRQRLASPRLQPGSQGILDVVRDLGCIQIDPISVVAPSHLIVLWSRLGGYDTRQLDSLLWNEHRLFEDWAHCTSIVPTEDFPIFSALKRGYGSSPKLHKWVEANKALRKHIIDQIHQEGPLSARDIEDISVADWQSTGWTAGRNVSQMLDFLWAKGEIMVARRTGALKFYDLTERVLPPNVSRESLSDDEARQRIAEKALRTLGVARPMQIRYGYVRGVPEHVDEVIDKLKAEDKIAQIEIRDSARNRVFRGPWYIHSEDLPLVDRLERGEWEPRTTLLSPFDNLIYDRQRTEQLFDFTFRLEIYVPKEQRQYGYYVLPILHDDRFIGRLDARMDRKQNQFLVNAIYVEPGAPKTVEAIKTVEAAISDLAGFLGAERITYGKRIPTTWKQVLRRST
jgi:uncharacterized protein YcaQ